ncbi:MFS transporter [Trueperella pyogenes]|uniref:MFS transporter n=1 Tax=Trueperella pyogenes TaxID=1661 RepID=UPI00345DE2B8
MRSKQGTDAHPFRRYLIAKCLIAAVVAWPVMTLVLQSKGLSYLQIGLLNSFGAAVSLILEVPMGRLADKFGQKHALAFGAAFVALGLGILALSSTTPVIYLSELIMGIGLALSSGADTAWLFAEHKRLSMEGDYLKSRSTIGSVTMLFSASSSVISPLLFSWGAGIPLWTSAVCYLAAAGTWAGLAVHAPSPSDVLDQQDAKRANKRRHTVFHRLACVFSNNSLFISLAFATTIVMTAVSNYSTYIGPFLQSQGLPVRYLGFVLVVGKIVQWLAIRNTYRLKKSTDEARLRVIAVIGFAILLLLASSSASSSAWVGGGAFVLMAGLSSTFFILIDEQVNLVISDKYRSTMLSVVAMFEEFSTIAIDPVIGAALDALGFSRAYLLLAALLCVAFGLAIGLAGVFVRSRLP